MVGVQPGSVRSDETGEDIAAADRFDYCHNLTAKPQAASNHPFYHALATLTHF